MHTRAITKSSHSYAIRYVQGYLAGLARLHSDLAKHMATDDRVEAALHKWFANALIVHAHELAAAQRTGVLPVEVEA
jgi:hypothetical protein